MVENLDRQTATTHRVQLDCIYEPYETSGWLGVFLGGWICIRSDRGPGMHCYAVCFKIAVLPVPFSVVPP